MGKTQVSLEFLVSYGWSIVAVILIVTALYSAGILYWQFPNQCVIYGDFKCIDFTVNSENKQVSILVTQDSDNKFGNVDIALESENCRVGERSYGAVFSYSGLGMSGSNNNVSGGTFYTTTFDPGIGNFYEPDAIQFTGIPPTPFDITDFQPGGYYASQAQAEGRYHYISGNTVLPDEPDGLYYVTGKATVSSDGSTGTVTVVAEKSVKSSSSDMELTSYVDNLLFFSNGRGNDVIKVSGDNNNLSGYLYAPNGEIEITGSTSNFVGGLVGNPVNIPGSKKLFVYESLNNNPFRLINTQIPDMWVPGKVVLLIFECRGTLSRNFRGSLNINFTSNGASLRNRGDLSATVY